MRGAVELEYDPKLFVIVNTDALEFADQEASMHVVIVEDSIQAESLILKINFSSPPPQFDRSDFRVEPLTCSKEDASWYMPLPPILDADVQVVTIKMARESELFTYSEEDQAVFFSNAVRPKVLAGLFCPTESEISLEFLLDSDVLGKASEVLTIQIKTKSSNNASVDSNEDEEDTNKSTFAGVSDTEVDNAKR